VSEAFLVSLRVVALALAFAVPAGLALGLLLARGRFAGRALVDALVLLPLVLPPSVVGYGLLLGFGRRGPVGRVLEALFGVRLVYSTAGAALAVAVVSLPLMAKGAEAAFAGVDRRLEEIARAHGMGGLRAFSFVTLPLAAPGLAVALTLTALRAFGEFGATLTFAGYLGGATATAPLELYIALQSGDDARAGRIALGLSLAAGLATLAIARWGRRRP
jgi:molybdate transport system permease protein